MNIPMLVAITQFAIACLALFLAHRAVTEYQWRKVRASLRAVQPLIEIAIQNTEKRMQYGIQDNLDEIAREMKLWFIYRYPTGDTCEVYTLDGWQLVDCDCEVDPYWFIEEPDEDELDENKFQDAKIGQFAQFYDICEQVEKLAKWKEINSSK